MIGVEIIVVKLSVGKDRGEKLRRKLLGKSDRRGREMIGVSDRGKINGQNMIG